MHWNSITLLFFSWLACIRAVFCLVTITIKCPTDGFPQEKPKMNTSGHCFANHKIGVPVTSCVLTHYHKHNYVYITTMNTKAFVVIISPLSNECEHENANSCYSLLIHYHQACLHVGSIWEQCCTGVRTLPSLLHNGANCTSGKPAVGLYEKCLCGLVAYCHWHCCGALHSACHTLKTHSGRTHTLAFVGAALCMACGRTDRSLWAVSSFWSQE